MSYNQEIMQNDNIKQQELWCKISKYKDIVSIYENIYKPVSSETMETATAIFSVSGEKRSLNVWLDREASMYYEPFSQIVQTYRRRKA